VVSVQESAVVMPAAEAKRRSWGRPLRVVAAVGAGVGLLLAFPPYGLWWLAPVAVALLAWAAHGQRLRGGFTLGLITGIVFFGPLLAWTNLHVGYAPWVLLTLFQATYLGLLGLALALMTPVVNRWPNAWPAVVALLWVAQEALRDRAPFDGFPWGRLAFSQGDSPALRFAALAGAPMVTFVVALAGGLLALALWRATNRAATVGEGANRAATVGEGANRAATVGEGANRAADGGAGTNSAADVGAGAAINVATDAGAIAVRWKPWLAIAGAGAVMAVGLAVPASLPQGRPVTVAIVQGNVPRMGLDFNEQRKAVLDNHVRATIELAQRVDRGEQRRPDLVIWPENASDIDPLLNEDAHASIDQAAKAIQAPILVGAVLRGPGENESRNAGIVWLPVTSDDRMYLKRHPVPFAEYLPLRPIVEPVAKMITNQAKLLRSDFVAGTTPGVLTMGPAKVGDVICFEVAYDELVRDVVTDGADLIAVQTNNATFDVAEATQQMAMVRLRAVEHGRDSLMASTVGISGFVTSDGKVHQPSQFNTLSVEVRELHTSDGSTTLATRLGAWPEWALTLIAFLMLLGGPLAIVLRRRGIV